MGDEEDSDDDEDGTTKVLELQVMPHMVSKHHKIKIECRATAGNGLYTSETIVNAAVRQQSSGSNLGSSSAISRHSLTVGPHLPLFILAPLLLPPGPSSWLLAPL